jgi:hypothetical protein
MGHGDKARPNFKNHYSFSYTLEAMLERMQGRGVGRQLKNRTRGEKKLLKGSTSKDKGLGEGEVSFRL